jgi:quinol monooxygenase YgiN
LAILRSVQGPTQAQPNCQSCRIYEEDGYEEAVLYMEQWGSEPDFQRHVRSDLYRRVLAAVELSRVTPEVAFHYVSETKGIKLLETLRGDAGQPETTP